MQTISWEHCQGAKIKEFQVYVHGLSEITEAAGLLSAPF